MERAGVGSDQLRRPRRDHRDFKANTKVATVTGLGYTATGLTNGTTYYFWVTAANGSRHEFFVRSPRRPCGGHRRGAHHGARSSGLG